MDPDDGDHVFVCLGGEFTQSKQQNLPYRGVDSNYALRSCSEATVIRDPDTNLPIDVNITRTKTCNHYEADEIAQIPNITANVMASLDFLSKDDQGFFLMYEQGDIVSFNVTVQ